MSGGGERDLSHTRAKDDRKRKEAATSEINRIFGIQPEKDALSPDFLKQNKKNPDAIKGMFADRSAEVLKNKESLEKLYAGNRDTVFDFNKIKLDKDLGDSKRELGFTLARSGLFGGSEDIRNKDLQNETYDKGVLTAKNMADQASADFRGRDESTRLDIINQIQSGADSSTAMQNALRGLQINAGKADASAKGSVIGNVFDDAGLIYSRDQQARGVEAARKKYGDQFGAFYPTGSSYTGTER